MARKTKKPAKRNEITQIVISALADLIVGLLLMVIEKLIDS